jgi:protein-S-isoprenylcysteine O-methyltransferase Ste14
VIPLAAGIALEAMVPLGRWRFRRGVLVLGVAAVISGVALSLGAAAAFGPIDAARPSRLVTSGPYALSRNPMYVGWTLIYAGVLLLLRTWWLVLLLIIPVVLTHLIVIPEEEREQAARFGDAYRDYRRRVRRYL